jgi:hypothetical protein
MRSRLTTTGLDCGEGSTVQGKCAGACARAGGACVGLGARSVGAGSVGGVLGWLRGWMYWFIILGDIYIYILVI